MKISYTGRHEAFPPKQQAKFEAKLQKLSKMIDRRGEKEAHVILTQQRFLLKVEITIRAWDHDMVGVGSGRDLVTAANDALEKLEKQVLKLRNKWRDTTRKKDKEAEAGASVAPSAKVRRVAAPARAAVSRGPKKIFRVNHSDGSNKPMTLEEAMLEMEASVDYMVYRDAQTDRVHVLMRRPDGHFDLIES
ncbi:MAG: ribosome-associated translation inhibitor RaiA [Acidobacteriia bacterium]|nr:ribosome-associated translation inhibitor RaiA [Terriglobia bacterium]